VDYLEERYQQLGIKTRRQTFSWRSINLANLIAEIPGRDRTLPPVLIADHYDTAIAEDHYAKTKERISTAGADDNGTGTATLLRAAEELKDKKPNRDIWILHLTGEEFPSDDLGIRYFMKGILQEKKDIAGMVLVDMIGFKEAGDPVFQINSGKTKESLALSKLAMQIAKNMKGPYVPTFRNRWGDEGYLYYTDGYILDSLGFPVILFNEHLNRKTFGKLNPYYHQTTDLPEHIDYSYAAHISKIAITTLWNAAK
jgi:Zn-dependent M28 family amino/carboxypeptidase